MNLIRWKPGELYSLRRNMDRMFDSLWNQSEDGEGTNSAVWTPSVDISETENGYVIAADLPGMNKEDFDISFSNGRLAISGERKSENSTGKDNVHRIERLYGRFTRSFELPQDADTARIDAMYKDGVLTLTIGKAEEAKPKQISVKVHA